MNGRGFSATLGKIVKNVFHNILEQASASCILKSKQKQEIKDKKILKNKTSVLKITKQIASIDEKIKLLKQSRNSYLKKLKELNKIKRH